MRNFDKRVAALEGAAGPDALAELSDDDLQKEGLASVRRLLEQGVLTGARWDERLASGHLDGNAAREVIQAVEARLVELCYDYARAPGYPQGADVSAYKSDLANFP